MRSLANPGRTFKRRNSIIDSGTERMPKKSLRTDPRAATAWPTMLVAIVMLCAH